MIVKTLVGIPVDVNHVGKKFSVSCLWDRTNTTFREWKCFAWYLASAAGGPEMVGVLLEHGANTDIYGGINDNLL